VANSNQIKAIAWDELYNVFLEQLNENMIGLMNSVLLTVERDVKGIADQTSLSTDA